MIRFLPVPFYLRLAALRASLQARLCRAPREVMHNLRSCEVGAALDPADVERIARDHVRARQFKSAYKRLPTLRGFDRPERWPVRGLEHLDDALSGGRGAMLATAHFASSHLIPTVLRIHDHEVFQVFVSRDGDEPVVTQESMTVGLNVRPLFEALSQNQVVVIAADGFGSASFENVTCLGTTFPLATGFMKIAMRAGAPLLPAFAFPSTGRHPIVVEIGTPLAIDPEAPVAENLQLFANSLDHVIREHPELWLLWRKTNLFEWARDWKRREISARYEPVLHRNESDRMDTLRR